MIHSFQKSCQFETMAMDIKSSLSMMIWENEKNQYVHRLVAIVYLDNPNNLPTVNHKDENKTNNHVSNLEWCTYQYNESYGTAKQRMVETRNKNGGFFAPEQALKVQMLDKNTEEVVQEFRSIKAAGTFLNKSASHINEAAHGKRKTAYGYKWRLVEE